MAKKRPNTSFSSIYNNTNTAPTVEPVVAMTDEAIAAAKATTQVAAPQAATTTVTSEAIKAATTAEQVASGASITERSIPTAQVTSVPVPSDAQKLSNMQEYLDIYYAAHAKYRSSVKECSKIIIALDNCILYLKRNPEPALFDLMVQMFRKHHQVLLDPRSSLLGIEKFSEGTQNRTSAIYQVIKMLIVAPDTIKTRLNPDTMGKLLNDRELSRIILQYINIRH